MWVANRLPIAIKSLEQLTINSAEREATSQVSQYKQNIKKFIQQVQYQVSDILQKHQKQIIHLQNQIKKLKQQNRDLKKQVKRSMVNYRSQKGQEYVDSDPDNINIQCLSPIRSRCKNSSVQGKMLATTKSNLFGQTAASQYIPTSPIKSSYKQRINHNLTSSLTYKDNENGATNKTISHNLQNYNYNTTSRIRNRNSKIFPIQIIDPESLQQQNTFREIFPSHNKSRFQIQSKIKKMRREEVIQYLEAGTKNLDQNTVKILKILGKAPPTEQNQQEQVSNEPNSKQKSRDEQLNSSLSAICDSLDNSFVARRARSAKAGKQAKQAELEQNRIQKQRQLQRIQRQRGIKNLLKGLRRGVQVSPKKEQVIKGSKLLSTGNNQKRSSKVMINPVPVQTQEQSRNRSNSPRKEGQQLGKVRNSILSKSLTGISVISNQ